MDTVPPVLALNGTSQVTIEAGEFILNWGQSHMMLLMAILMTKLNGREQ